MPSLDIMDAKSKRNFQLQELVRSTPSLDVIPADSGFLLNTAKNKFNSKPEVWATQKAQQYSTPW